MEIITKREQIKAGISDWSRYYGYRPHCSGQLSKLQQLDPETCSSEDVEKVIGNDSWTALYCDECKRPVEAVAQFDTEDYDRPLRICLSCLKAAVKKLEGL